GLDACGQPYSYQRDDLPNCRNYVKVWTYAAIRNQCLWFNYGGCFGNDNRFATFEECERRCVYKKGRRRNL
ncbi:hypothetical protein KR222_007938, partial [Zaprionus bogoriensis]